MPIFEFRCAGCGRKFSALIGMTAEQVEFARGRPGQVHETTTASGRYEQWVYGVGDYVQLANGIVTAIQRSR